MKEIYLKHTIIGNQGSQNDIGSNVDDKER